MELLFAAAKKLADEQATIIKIVRKDIPTKMKNFVDKVGLERILHSQTDVSCIVAIAILYRA